MPVHVERCVDGGRLRHLAAHGARAQRAAAGGKDTEPLTVPASGAISTEAVESTKLLTVTAPGALLLEVPVYK